MVADLTHFQRHYQGNLPVVAQEFAESVHKQERRAAWLKRTLAVSGFAVLILMLVGASVGLYLVAQEKKKADESARIAQERLAQQLQAEKERLEAERQRKEAEQKTVALKDKARSMIVVRHNLDTLDRQVPAWLETGAEGNQVTVLDQPMREHIDVPVRESLIVELYSK